MPLSLLSLSLQATSIRQGNITLTYLAQICLHYFISTFREENLFLSSIVSVERFKTLTGNITHQLYPNSTTNDTVSIYGHERRANATFVFLCRNSDLEGVVTSIVQIEDRFNKWYGYPWVLLNEEPFTDNFKKCVKSVHFPLTLFHKSFSGELKCSQTLLYRLELYQKSIGFNPIG
jgi:Glycolipid 2-alpha-mannosyltransferase